MKKSFWAFLIFSLLALPCAAREDLSLLEMSEIFCTQDKPALTQESAFLLSALVSAEFSVRNFFSKELLRFTRTEKNASVFKVMDEALRRVGHENLDAQMYGRLRVEAYDIRQIFQQAKNKDIKNMAYRFTREFYENPQAMESLLNKEFSSSVLHGYTIQYNKIKDAYESYLNSLTRKRALRPETAISPLLSKSARARLAKMLLKRAVLFTLVFAVLNSYGADVRTDAGGLALNPGKVLLLDYKNEYHARLLIAADEVPELKAELAQKFKDARVLAASRRMAAHAENEAKKFNFANIVSME